MPFFFSSHKVPPKSPHAFSELPDELEREQKPTSEFYKAVPKSDFEKKSADFIDAGSFSSVYKISVLRGAQCLDAKAEYVLKELGSTASAQNAKRQLQREVAIARALASCPAILTTVGGVMEGDCHGIVMRRAHGTLRDVAVAFNKCMKATRRTLKEYCAYYNFVTHAMLGVVTALEHMHARNVIHCDVKPANVFLLQPFDVDHFPDVALGDFGSAQLVIDATKPQEVTDVTCTPFYTAPESISVPKSEEIALATVLRPGDASPPPKVSQASDVWALGVSLLEMANQGINPLISEFATFERFVSEVRPDLVGLSPSRQGQENVKKKMDFAVSECQRRQPIEFPSALLQLAKKCLKEDASQRCTLLEVRVILEELLVYPYAKFVPVPKEEEEAVSDIKIQFDFQLDDDVMIDNNLRCLRESLAKLEYTESHGRAVFLDDFGRCFFIDHRGDRHRVREAPPSSRSAEAEWRGKLKDHLRRELRLAEDVSLDATLVYSLIASTRLSEKHDGHALFRSPDGELFWINGTGQQKSVQRISIQRPEVVFEMSAKCRERAKKELRGKLKGKYDVELGEEYLEYLSRAIDLQAEYKGRPVFLTLLGIVSYVNRSGQVFRVPLPEPDSIEKRLLRLLRLVPVASRVEGRRVFIAPRGKCFYITEEGLPIFLPSSDSSAPSSKGGAAKSKHALMQELELKPEVTLDEKTVALLSMSTQMGKTDDGKPLYVGPLGAQFYIDDRGTRISFPQQRETFSAGRAIAADAEGDPERKLRDELKLAADFQLDGWVKRLIERSLRFHSDSLAPTFCLGPQGGYFFIHKNGNLDEFRKTLPLPQVNEGFETSDDALLRALHLAEEVTLSEETKALLAESSRTNVALNGRPIFVSPRGGRFYINKDGTRTSLPRRFEGLPSDTDIVGDGACELNRDLHKSLQLDDGVTLSEKVKALLAKSTRTSDTHSGRLIFLGPLGGRFYINKKGNRIYLQSFQADLFSNTDFAEEILSALNIDSDTGVQLGDGVTLSEKMKTLLAKSTRTSDTHNGRPIFAGPRGGRFYINKDGTRTSLPRRFAGLPSDTHIVEDGACELNRDLLKSLQLGDGVTLSEKMKALLAKSTRTSDTHNGRPIFVGPLGGRFYINKKGKRVFLQSFQADLFSNTDFAEDIFGELNFDSDKGLQFDNCVAHSKKMEACLANLTKTKEKHNGRPVYLTSRGGRFYISENGNRISLPRYFVDDMRGAEKSRSLDNFREAEENVIDAIVKGLENTTRLDETHEGNPVFLDPQGWRFYITNRGYIKYMERIVSVQALQKEGE